MAEEDRQGMSVFLGDTDTGFTPKLTLSASVFKHELLDFLVCRVGHRECARNQGTVESENLHVQLVVVFPSQPHRSGANKQLGLLQRTLT